MRLKLEDNAQEAFQFLLLGAAIVLILRLAIYGAGMLVMSGETNELHEVTGLFRNNYIIDPDILVADDTDITTRLSLAAVLAVAAAIFFGAITALIARVAGRRPVESGVAGARYGLILAALLLVNSSLFLPPRTVEFSEQGCHLHHRNSIGGIGVPWPSSEEFIPWSSVDRVEHHVVHAGMGACGTRVETIISTGDQRIPLAGATPSGRDCDVALTRATEKNKALTALIRNQYLRGDPA